MGRLGKIVKRRALTFKDIEDEIKEREERYLTELKEIRRQLDELRTLTQRLQREKLNISDAPFSDRSLQ